MDPLIIDTELASLHVTPKTDTIEVVITDNVDGTSRLFQCTAKQAFQLHTYFLKAAVKVQSNEPSPLATR